MLGFLKVCIILLRYLLFFKAINFIVKKINKIFILEINLCQTSGQVQVICTSHILEMYLGMP